ncbi:cytochrome c oxidase subunit II [Telmatospirillum siberiense]|uniref:Cytochrome c oxidase subunit 2 n=1 Tax=Telmatospirillum siberiense TaxID=382514 RepID=A0A2N3PR16_9PROT|nr:cytochrome c oxidase subunit II [Telmatospirillum siberiense]PKU22845.1 cytochrome c oxidase subunit II [Telmatospirillum siberiense]
MSRIVPATSVFSAAATLASPALADQPKAWGIWMQEAASPTMHQITTLNTTITVIILFVLAFVFVLLGYVVVRFHASRNPTPAKWEHNTPLEVAWTLIPVLILVVIAFPSFRLLYAMDRAKDADMTLKVTGHQWYWSYDYPDQSVSFDANMVQEGDLKPGEPRLLATDNHIVLPVDTTIRIQTTADDVIHSWSVPSLGVKIDAFPGRLNETWVKIERPGFYFGQCSQLCGINHGFMPIEVEAVTKEQFTAWIKNQGKRTSSADGRDRLANAAQ